MAYLEKKIINGKAYYYLTETKRIGNKFKKTRKYIGKDLAVKARGLLTKKETAILERIRKAAGKASWKPDRETLVSFIYNTNAIEGNTFTHAETDKLLKGRTKLRKDLADLEFAAEKPHSNSNTKLKGNTQTRDAKEILNMQECIDYILGYKGELGETLVLELHGIEMKGLLPDAGSYRTVNVRVGGYICPEWKEIPMLMREFFSWYSKSKNLLHPFELAALAHLQFVRIHPFRDGNGRMARLLMNFLLMKNGFPLLNILNKEKMLYYLNLRKFDYGKKEKPFIKYLLGVYSSQWKKQK